MLYNQSVAPNTHNINLICNVTAAAVAERVMFIYIRSDLIPLLLTATLSLLLFHSSVSAFKHKVTIQVMDRTGPG